MNKPLPPQSVTVIRLLSQLHLCSKLSTLTRLSWSRLILLGPLRFLLVSPHPQTRRKELYISRSIFTCSNTCSKTDFGFPDVQDKLKILFHPSTHV